MTKLSKEVESLTQEDGVNILKHVSYEDLQREFWLLAREKRVDVLQGLKLPSDRDATLNVTKPRVCIVEGCESAVKGRAKKCEGCRK